MYSRITSIWLFCLLSLLLWVTPLSVGSAQQSSTNRLSSLFSSAKPEFLPPDQAFIVSAHAPNATTIAITWQIAEGYYLYKKRIGFSTETAGISLGSAELPAGEIKHDEYFGDMEVYHRQVTAVIPVTATTSLSNLKLSVKYQGCAEGGLCYNPLIKSFDISLPPNQDNAGSSPNNTRQNSLNSNNAPSEQDRLAELIRSGHIAAVLGTFFSIGLLLAFTPCVLPMIPILSGIIVGQGSTITPTRGLSLAMSYVQGLALTYASAAVLFVLIFKQAPQAFFQKPWVIASFAGLFVILGLAMLGKFTLQLPAGLQTRLTELNNKVRNGTYVGTFIMGALSALIVTACVAPALVAALSIMSQTRLVARSAAALYFMGLGMGTPLLLAGASAGSLLPKAGAWMQTIKSLFALVFFGVAIYLLSSLLPSNIIQCLWSALLLSTGFYLLKTQARNSKTAFLVFRGIGIISLIYGTLLLVNTGLGYNNALRPLQSIDNLIRTNHSIASNSRLTFTRIRSINELDIALASAKAQNKSVMLDFYADWCVSCKEMENYTFNQPSVQQALRETVLLQIDVTANTDDDRALLQRFGIYGPPTIAFFINGIEHKAYRVVGYMPDTQFIEHINKAFNSR